MNTGDRAKPALDSTSQEHVIVGWKRIAEELGVTPRTAQNWEHELGLGIHRTVGTPNRVWITRSELDQWWKEVTVSRHRPESRRLWSWLRHFVASRHSISASQ